MYTANALVTVYRGIIADAYGDAQDTTQVVATGILVDISNTTRPPAYPGARHTAPVTTSSPESGRTSTVLAYTGISYATFTFLNGDRIEDRNGAVYIIDAVVIDAFMGQRTQRMALRRLAV